MKPLFRKMEKSDLKEVGEIFYNTFNSVGEPWTKVTSQQYVKENYHGDCHFVALLDKKIIGMLMAIPLTREKGTELFIDSIVVLPEYQKTSIGKKLWKKANVYAKDNHFTGIRLLTNPQLESFNWYKKMGYKKSGWIEVYKLFF